MLLSLFLFFVGFYILIKGANLLVDGAASLASRFHIPPFVVGLLIVGIGTSIPEFATFFISHITGGGEIGVGTILGSNTFNILFILGITALFFPIHIKKEWVEKDMLWNVAAVMAVVLFSFWSGKGVISRLDGLLLLFIFLYWLFISIHTRNRRAKEWTIEVKEKALFVSFGIILLGFFGIILGGKWVVDGAITLARGMGVTERVIGLTIVGIGTSLPEFVASFVAAYRKQPGIAVGNIIGSNIFDFLMIFGFGALAKPIVFDARLSLDMTVTFFAAVILYGSMFVGKKYILERFQGLAFIALYFFYFIYLFQI